MTSRTPGRSPTLKDVASQAGVHPSTVSRALSPHTRPLVNDDTAKKVMMVADRLGYRPNSLARALKTNRTLTIGMLLPDLTNPLFPPIVRGIEDTLGASDYTVILANTDNDEGKERSIVRSMLDRRVDGLVLATARLQAPIVDELVEMGLPLVLVNRTTDNPKVPSVIPDDHAGVGLAVGHLVELGHTRIAHVAGPQDFSTGLARYHAFCDSMEEEGLTPDPDLVVFADRVHEEPGARALAELYDRGQAFTAILAANDLVAIGCYDILGSRGLTVGGDVSVVGYNDMPFADRLSPPLTTVRIPQYEIGVRSAELILKLVGGETPETMTVGLRPSLVVRGSTGSPQ